MRVADPDAGAHRSQREEGSLSQAPESVHVPVLVEEVLELAALEPGQRTLDLTVGAAGHASRFLERVGESGAIVGVDRDRQILQVARERLGGRNAHLLHGSFGALDELRERLPFDRFDVVLADLGVSSLQLDDATRGFSFRSDAPLDMRMDPTAGQSASEFIAGAHVEEITRVLAEYGEERYSARIARAIVAARAQRPIATTRALAEIVRAAMPRSSSAKDRIDPATRTFQAIRIAVNGELDALDALLRDFASLLASGGRFLVISFHSLEDRRVKLRFRDRCREGDYDLLTKKAVRPSTAETERNPRARSSRLRAIQRKA